jgi:hypothetical protein
MDSGDGNLIESALAKESAMAGTRLLAVEIRQVAGSTTVPGHTIKDPEG